MRIGNFRLLPVDVMASQSNHAHLRADLERNKHVFAFATYASAILTQNCAGWSSRAGQLSAPR